MIYLLCTNCPRYMGSAQALATSLTQTWRHQRSPNWVTYESLVNNLPLIYESRGLYETMPPRIITAHAEYKIIMHSNHAWQTSQWHGQSVWRWERGGRSHVDLWASADTNEFTFTHRASLVIPIILLPILDHRYRHQHHRCHSSCLTHIQVNPSLICHRLVICSQNSLILCNFLCD